MSQIKPDYQIRISQYEDKIDRKINPTDLAKYPELKNLYDLTPQESDIIIYNDFPKDIYSLHGLKDLPGRIKIGYWAWEESVYPAMWVKEINENLHGIATISSFVRDVLKKNGVKIPIEVIDIGIDRSIIVEPKAKFPINSTKNFKFLNISSAKARKGIDVLIQAFCGEFTINDDVALVIKSFPGPDNKVNELIQKFKTENSPEIVHIFQSELSDQEIVNLMHSCDCAVYPSRAEGFGLPAAEAMLHGIPLIATGYSGFLDFANEGNSYLLDYKIEDALASEFANPGAKWAEPNLQDLKKKMRVQYDIFEYKKGNTANLDNSIQTEIEIQKDKIENAFESAKELTWERAAEQMFLFIEQIEQVYSLKTKKVGVISFMNNKDGIAKYTKDLFENIESSFQEFYYISNTDIIDRAAEDSANVIRTWESGTNNFDSTIDFIKSKNLDLIHIQYHSGINFSFASLGKLIQQIKKLNIKCYLTLHAVRGKNFDMIAEVDDLKLVDKLFIHSKEDYRHAATKLSNVVYFNLPKSTYPKRDKNKLKKQLGLQDSYPIITTHGMLNAAKCDLVSVVEAISKLKEKYENILYLALNAVVPNNINAESEYQKILDLIKKNKLEKNVVFVTDFLSDDVIHLIIQSSDVIVVPYKEVGESASAAIGRFLYSGSPCVVTDIKMFDDLTKEVYKIESTDSELILQAIEKLIAKESRMYVTSMVDAAEKFVLSNSYVKKSREMLKWYI